MASDNFSLEGKTAYILGSSGLIGRDVSLQMAKSGCKVILLDNDIKSSKRILKTVKEFSKDSKEAYFDCSDMENLEENFENLIIKFSYKAINIFRLRNLLIKLFPTFLSPYLIMEIRKGH